MGLAGCRNKKLIYHLTPLSNLESILDKGLLSRKELEKNQENFSDIADQEIIAYLGYI